MSHTVISPWTSAEPLISDSNGCPHPPVCRSYLAPSENEQVPEPSAGPFIWYSQLM